MAEGNKASSPSLPDLIDTVKHDALDLIERGRRGDGPKFNPDVLVNPKRYARPIKLDKIIADTKYSKSCVEYYKKKIEANKPIDPIVVVKHPHQDVYAVLDGHHRYYAHRELGKETISCAVAEDYSSVLFYLTERGYLQPSAEITEHLRQPAKKMHKNLREFLVDFLDDQKISQELEKRKTERETRLKKSLPNAIRQLK
jgi:uncharacterized ParB-like nuclease family protein